MTVKNKTVLITGASAGIGEACAEVFAEAGARLILVARRAEKLDKMATDYKEKFETECHILPCDVRSFKDVSDSYNSMPDYWKEIDVLINNAGLARGLSKIQDGNIEDWDEMIDTNVKGLLYVSRVIMPTMIERHEGLIINIGSLAGREVYPNGNIYCSTKHAVKALSKAMIIDLNGTGVRVTNLDPGLVKTDFSYVRFRGDKQKAEAVYEGYEPLVGRDIAEVALFAATRPQHVVIQDILVTPTAQASVGILASGKGYSK
jgi:serine 3-dehydrogenase